MGEKRVVLASRDLSMDYMKGLLTVLMILAHCIQFFGDESKLIQGAVVSYINLTSFSGFFFVFGYVCCIAYFKKPFKTAGRKMLLNAAKTLFAFYVSSLAYFAFVDGRIFGVKFVGEVLSVRVYAGWSEFLISFSAVMLLAIILFPLLKRANIIFLTICFAFSLALCLFCPYASVKEPLAALFVGSEDFVTFPVLQYFFYFAAGVCLCKKRESISRGGLTVLLVIAFLLSLPCGIYLFFSGGMPERFPPTFFWVFGAAFFVFLYYMFFRVLAGLKPKNAFARLPLAYLYSVGGNTLAYLLLSNVLIFALKGSHFFLMGNPVFVVVLYIFILIFAFFVTGGSKSIRAFCSEYKTI